MDAAALLCNICPKHPRFSDVSHLLTHVSSKAHLSHYFKLQVRSHQEPQAGSLLDQYNQWYKANNLAKLLSDRMSSKTSRKKKTQGKSPVQNKASDAERGDRHENAAFYSSLPDYIDPRLSDPFLSVESDIADKESSIPSYKSLTTTSIPDHQTHQRVGYSLASMISPNSQTVLAIPRRWKPENDLDSEDDGVSKMHFASYWSSADVKPDVDTQSLTCRFSHDPFIDDNDGLEYANNSEMDKERADEIARLKGVLWPGMDIFDSATEQMRRKRNQKKDESILKMMEKTSLCVEPTELVFSPTGILRKQRVISGNVEDSSPLKGETPILKKRATRSKRVLSQADPNVQRGSERKRARKNSRRDPNILENDDIEQRGFRPLTNSLLKPPIHFGNSNSQGDSMDEFALSFKNPPFKTLNKFDIFRDVPNVHGLNTEDQHCNKQLPRGESTSSQSLFLRHENTVHGGLTSPRPASHPTKLFQKGAHPIVDKENIEPLLNVYGRIDLPVDWHSPSTKRNLSTDIGLPPQYFFTDTHNIELGQFECHNALRGYSYNPLVASFSRASAEQNPIYTSESSYTLKAQPTAYANSPEATISDVGDDDFERLYLDGTACEL